MIINKMISKKLELFILMNLNLLKKQINSLIKLKICSIQKLLKWKEILKSNYEFQLMIIHQKQQLWVHVKMILIVNIQKKFLLLIQIKDTLHFYEQIQLFIGNMNKFGILLKDTIFLIVNYIIKDIHIWGINQIHQKISILSMLMANIYLLIKFLEYTNMKVDQIYKKKIKIKKLLHYYVFYVLNLKQMNIYITKIILKYIFINVKMKNIQKNLIKFYMKLIPFLVKNFIKQMLLFKKNVQNLMKLFLQQNKMNILIKQKKYDIILNYIFEKQKTEKTFNLKFYQFHLLQFYINNLYQYQYSYFQFLFFIY
ncbi:hypothetical protein IMG5_068600 [Ichthyophthirius multifiliis]|uniref:Transmembrane protein n=1 Tax=Ichthyophthirius multifiliis TaxID=5932 RepID=G0QPJ5_ICHMU|nr:hypothetical protein IMG5_068600 [Ichthyophthirius multifiliis]EGR32860.1 hypothetical protein IMG5_068600 [Ichthyophthirius multifiliis]|eukprot:XP_004036846.1 hypothetical protein IMG5_068600 [Ichthyophthirius multifiliis]